MIARHSAEHFNMLIYLKDYYSENYIYIKTDSEEPGPCHSLVSCRIICDPHRGSFEVLVSFAVQFEDHLWLATICSAVHLAPFFYISG